MGKRAGFADAVYRAETWTVNFGTKQHRARFDIDMPTTAKSGFTNYQGILDCSSPEQTSTHFGLHAPACPMISIA